MNVLIFCWKKCKDHGGPVTDLKELNQLVKNASENKLKKLLQQEIASQKWCIQMMPKKGHNYIRWFS